MEYHKTKDILHVMRIPGHKNIKNTLRYTQLIQRDETEDDFVCKLARTPTEIQSLIEADFEYVCDLDSLWFFRKPKEKSVAGLCQNDVEMPRAGFEPATTVCFSNNKDFLRDLENFKLFSKSKLNLSQGTVYHYTSKICTFMLNRKSVTDRDVQEYIEKKKQECCLDYVSNIISAFKAYFRDYKGLTFMNGYRHPSSPLKFKEEIEPGKVRMFIEAVDDLTVKCMAILLATSGMRKSEVWNLRKSEINRKLRCIIPNCHSGETKQSGISFYNEETASVLEEYLEQQSIRNMDNRLFVIGHARFLRIWNEAREKSGIYLKPKDLRDFFSQELGKALIPDRFIDIFQGRSPRNVLAKHYTPQGLRLLREIYDKANLRVLS
jgi:integrase